MVQTTALSVVRAKCQSLLYMYVRWRRRHEHDGLREQLLVRMGGKMGSRDRHSASPAMLRLRPTAS
jgi:hypothetical protein